jgi:hypothetical protein
MAGAIKNHPKFEEVKAAILGGEARATAACA